MGKNSDSSKDNKIEDNYLRLQRELWDEGRKAYFSLYENAIGKEDIGDGLHEFWGTTNKDVDFFKWRDHFLKSFSGPFPQSWTNKMTANMNEFTLLFPFYGNLDLYTEENQKLWASWLDFCTYYQKRIQGDEAEVFPQFDKRFRNGQWQESLLHDALRHMYVMVSEWWHNSVSRRLEDDETLSEIDKKRAEFNLRLLLSAISPSNFVLTNPEVIEATLSSNGQNLVRGMEHFLKDLVENKGQWRVATVDHEAFDVGRNLAQTEGEVIFSTPLFELIQYGPSRDSELQEPILLVPPVINKYYVLDMQEHNSFVRWARDEGLSVFLISWVNPDATLRDKGFGDYVQEIETALTEVASETGVKRVHVLGYCVGGTMLSACLAKRAAQKQMDIEVVSATFLTSLIDFEEAGDIRVFLNEDQMALIEDSMKEKGYFDAYAMASSFSLLRANDLIWSFVVNNYLLGKEPPPFDLLYWNNDSTNLTERFFREYLDIAYIGNKLCRTGDVEIDGVGIDMSRVTVPSCFVASEEDHIAPWRSCFASARVLSGKKTFILGGSGHVNGMINPPAKNKYHYRTMQVGRYTNPDSWFEVAKLEKGSWWPCWYRFIREHSSKELVTARKPATQHPSLAKAPGNYVLRRS